MLLLAAHSWSLWGGSTLLRKRNLLRVLRGVKEAAAFWEKLTMFKDRV